MTTAELELIVHRKPFEPFRLITIDGEEVTVTQPRKAHVSGDTVSLHGVTRAPNAATREGLRMIRADKILRAEPLDGTEMTNAVQENPRKAVFGSWKGKVWIADNFNAPLPEDELREWEK